ncbi:MAG: septal ring lytic transglycosylase RlpA family protein [Campylobacterales bacterium]|nr:septal ring lytic transglycosylase RlpA family protein [Campylobacterales bacterium]
MRLSLAISLFSVLAIFFSGCSRKSYNYNYNQQIDKDVKPKDSLSMYKATMRPYQINGKTYYPTFVEVGDVYDGIASWYGPDFNGKLTSNGEIYNMNSLTAAHKTFPMNTMVKVDNVENGKSTVVRINDRGPFVGDRIIDLSKAAAQTIGMHNKGLAKVKLTVLGFDSKILALVGGSQSARDTQPQRVEISDFGIQIGAFKRKEGAVVTQQKYSLVDGRYKAIIKESSKDDFYRVWLMGFQSEAEAKDFISTGRFDGAFIVRE